MDDEIKQRLATLEAEVVALKALVHDVIDGIEYGEELHLRIHRDLDKMTFMSFHKTHPEVSADMRRFDEIAAGKIEPGKEPKG